MISLSCSLILSSKIKITLPFICCKHNEFSNGDKIIKRLLFLFLPCSSTFKLNWRFHLFVWVPSIATAVILVANDRAKNAGMIEFVLIICFMCLNIGLSMFYYCWVSVKDWNHFTAYSWSLLIAPQFASFIISIAVLIFAMVVLLKRIPTSDESRIRVLRQSAWYVLALTFETMTVGGIWVTEFAVVDRDSDPNPCFCNERSFVLAIAFAAVHSLRGVFDCIIWFLVFSIGPKDFNLILNKCLKFCCRERWNVSNLEIPLLVHQETPVDKSLRKFVIYCINRGMLDVINEAIAKEEEENRRIGNVPNQIVAAVMLEHADAEEEYRAEKDLFDRSNDSYIRKVHLKNVTFSFVSMQPDVFRLLWKSLKVNFQTFRHSFMLEDMSGIDNSGILEKFTEGKSGSFFYFTQDRRYIIKTVSSGEEKFLRNFVRQYYRYMKDNPESLIVRFYGLYQVQLAWEQKYISVVVMENIFYSIQQLKIHEKYDLKGSTVGRRVLKGGKSATSSMTLKDLDLQRKVYIGAENKALFMEQLKKDVRFLASHNIMDYSLLLGIHDHKREENHSSLTTGNLITNDGFEIVTRGSRHPSISLGGQGAVRTERSSTIEESFTSNGVHPWFRQDFGGLRSYTPYHPIHNGNEEFDFSNTYDGRNIDSLPIHTYYFGLVDIFQKYNLKKKAERFWKAGVCRLDPNGISVTDPEKYASRFLEYISTKLA